MDKNKYKILDKIFDNIFDKIEDQNIGPMLRLKHLTKFWKNSGPILGQQFWLKVWGKNFRTSPWN